MMENYSLSDIANACGDGKNSGFGNGAWWIIILFLFLFGANGNAFGGNGANSAGGANSYVTTSQFESENNFQTLDRKLNDIGDGLCNLGYTQANLINQGVSSINGNISTEGRALQMQLAQCCCDNQLAIKDLMAQNDKNTCSILTALSQNQIQNLRDKVGKLELDSALCGVVRYPTPAYCCPPPCSGGCGTSF